MDVFTDLLDGVRARSAVLHKAGMAPGWSMRIDDGAPLVLVAVVQGHLWFDPDEGEPVRAGAGDVMIVCEPTPYSVGDEPGLPPQIVARPGGRYTTVDGVDITDGLFTGPRTCAGDEDHAAVVVCGTYQATSDVNRRLLAALPRVLVVPSGHAPAWVLQRLGDEVTSVEPGQPVVLDRLLDLALVATLRAWFALPDAEVPGWYRAQSDPVVGRALQLMHDDPAHPWTVASLAAKAGASRAWFARRFTELLGQPPMTYLADWRVTRAADRLRQTDATITAIARDSGYANPFTFSVAFKRVKGVSPSQYRAG